MFIKGFIFCFDFLVFKISILNLSLTETGDPLLFMFLLVIIKRPEI